MDLPDVQCDWPRGAAAAPAADRYVCDCGPLIALPAPAMARFPGFGRGARTSEPVGLPRHAEYCPTGYCFQNIIFE